MTMWIAEGAGVLLQLAAAAGDTVLVKQVVSDPSWWDRVTSIASGLVSISILVLTFALVPAAWNFRQSYKKISELLDRVYADINPITRHASNIADNVDFISTSVRVDVQQVNRTIALANERLQQAVAMTEQRLNDFNAFLEVVQHEAENVFVASASTLHGVRTGAAAYRERPVREDLREDLRDELEDELDEDLDEDLDEVLDEDDALALAAGTEHLLDEEALIALETQADADAMIDGYEVTDGNDNEAEGRGPSPRIRSRTTRGRRA